MKRSLLPRNTAKLPGPLNHQLSLYALAASAAGVGLLALSRPAEAKIIYTKTHQGVGGYYLDLDNSGTGDFLFSTYGNCTSFGGLCQDELTLLDVRGSDRFEEHSSLVVALSKGAVVGPKSPFLKHQRAAVMAYVEWTSAQRVVRSSGNWINVKNRYLGLKFGIKGKTHYGWARLDVSFQPKGGISGTLTGYAYETVPSKPIIAGKTKGPDVITAQPTTLGRLALGRK